MEQTSPATGQASRIAAATDAQTTWSLVKLFSCLLLGAAMVWLLRQDSAKDQSWLWLPFLVAMFGAASALRQLDLWLPGQPILPRLEPFPPRFRDIFGAICVAVAQGLSWLIVQRLLPDYQTRWPGLPALWIASILLLLTGASMIGVVGKGSPRAATSSTLWNDSPRSRRLEIVAFIVIFALAIFLRTYRINSIPSGIYVDETNGALDSLYILEGRSASPFATGWYGTPNGYLYYMAGIFKLLGANWIALKVASLIPAILSVAAIYFLGRLIFGPSAGLMAMLFMAVSRWHLSMSRWGWNETAPPLFQILATFFLIRGLRDRRAFDYALSGVLMSLSLYTYLSARLAVATLLLYILYWILSDPSGVRASLRRSWLGLVLFIIAALVAIAPAAVTYVKDPATTNNRVSEISILKDIREQGSIKPLIQNIGDILKFFHQTGDLQGKHNLPGEPMTDPFTGSFFAVGFAYALYRWRDQRYFLLMIWLVIGLAGSFLSSHSESPQSYRSLTALPAVVLLAADALDRVTRAGYRALQERSSTTTRPQLPVYFAAGFAVLMLTGATFWESTVYFGRQAHSAEVQRGFNQTENSVAHEVIAALQAGQEVYLSPKFSTYSPLRFLVYGVIKEKTGANTLDAEPYHVVIPEVNFPLPDTGNDVLILLDSNYWPLRDFLTSIYPDAHIELVTLADDSPLYIRMRIPHEQISALQGLTESITYVDGRTEQRTASQVKMDLDAKQVSQIQWSGAIRMEHGGIYELRGDGGLEVFVDGLPVSGAQYFGRGLYHIVLKWNEGDSAKAQLLWQAGQAPNTALVPVPAESLFRLPERQQGLLAIYWNNTNWEDTPVFHQVTPFLMLAWPDEQPIVPNGPFTARYMGLLNITRAGIYTFRIEADDGARLVIDDTVLAEGMVAGQPNTFEVTVPLIKGSRPIRIDYLQQGGGSALRVFWRQGDEPFTPIPPSALIPARP